MPELSRWYRRLGTAVLLCVLAVTSLGVDGAVYDHYVREPTRHCRMMGRLPSFGYALGLLNLALTVAAIVVLVRVVHRAPRRAGVPATLGTVLAYVLLVGAALLLAVDALTLYLDFHPYPLDPFNCGD